MSLGTKKKNDLKYHNDVEEFIPYAAHFDEQTLITKNGELLQTIKITGFSFELSREQKEDIETLRSLVRKALKNNVNNDGYSFWIHTIRRQEDLSTGGTYERNLNKNINETWIEQNKWRTQYINELYITILKQGEVFPLKNAKILANFLFVGNELEERKRSLQQAVDELGKVVDSVVADLEKVGARKLSIFKRNGIYYSELISLISKIMNLKQEEVPLQTADLSTVLPTNRVNFQYNTVQVEGDTKKHFGTVYSIKEYREVTDKELDKLTQLPINLIITQSFAFVNKEIALKEFKDQKKIYELSGSKFMMEISGLKEIFEEGADENIGYGEQQITLTVIEDNAKALQRSVAMVVDVLREMGVVFVREDLFMENCYWSALPANFDFIRRKTFLPLKKIAGYGSLHSYTSGKLSDNFWGSALTVFNTTENMPYFFNFHLGDKGNALIVGAEEVARTNLLNFIISQAQKFNPRTYFIESNNRAEIFIRAHGGEYLEGIGAYDSAKADTNMIGIKTPPEKDPVLTALNKILQELTSDQPTIIVLDEGISSIGDESFIIELIKVTEQLNQKNAVLIFLADDKLKQDASGIFKPEFREKMTNMIFMPNATADFNYKEVFGIKERDLKAIKVLNETNSEFLIKRAGEDVILRFDSDKIKKTLSALITTEERKMAMQTAIDAAGSKKPDAWLKIYFSKFGL